MTYDGFINRTKLFASKKGRTINDVDVIDAVLNSLTVSKKIDRATAKRWFLVARA